MKQYLILMALGSGFACGAEREAPAPLHVSDARPTAVKTSPSATSSAMPRQLSAEERAELRRQLYEFSRPHGKHS